MLRLLTSRRAARCAPAEGEAWIFGKTPFCDDFIRRPDSRAEQSEFGAWLRAAGAVGVDRPGLVICTCFDNPNTAFSGIVEPSHDRAASGARPHPLGVFQGCERARAWLRTIESGLRAWPSLVATGSALPQCSSSDELFAVAQRFAAASTGDDPFAAAGSPALPDQRSIDGLIEATLACGPSLEATGLAELAGLLFTLTRVPPGESVRVPLGDCQSLEELRRRVWAWAGILTVLDPRAGEVSLLCPKPPFARGWLWLCRRPPRAHDARAFDPATAGGRFGWCTRDVLIDRPDTAEVDLARRDAFIARFLDRQGLDRSLHQVLTTLRAEPALAG